MRVCACIVPGPDCEMRRTQLESLAASGATWRAKWQGKSHGLSVVRSRLLLLSVVVVVVVVQKPVVVVVVVVVLSEEEEEVLHRTRRRSRRRNTASIVDCGSSSRSLPRQGG